MSRSVAIIPIGSCASPSDETPPDLYVMAPVDPLPVVDLSVTFASRFARSQRNAEAINNALLHVHTAHRNVAQILHALSCITAGFVLYTDEVTAPLLAWCTLMLSLPLTLPAFGLLSWPIAKLLLQTFEFWFLSGTNAMNTAIMISMLRDGRVVVLVFSFLGCQFALFSDANMHSRQMEWRMLLVGAPSLLFGVGSCVLRLGRNLSRKTFRVLNIEIDDTELLLNGNLVVVFFILARLLRNRHVRSAKTHSQAVVCQMYYPIIRLEPVSSDAISHTMQSSRLGTEAEWIPTCSNPASEALAQPAPVSTPPYRQRLLTASTRQERVFDATKTIGSRVVRRRCSCNRRGRSLSSALFTMGVVGAGLLAGLVVYVSTNGAMELLLDQEPRALNDRVVDRLAITSFCCSIVFQLACAANYEPALTKLVLFEPDAWFVSLHLTSIAVAAADVFCWSDSSLLFATVWCWGHWLIFLDALPPSTRRRLCISQTFIVVIHFILLGFVGCLVFWVYFAGIQGLQNREIIALSLLGVQMRMHMHSFLGSKVLTMALWLARFLWREVVRPRGSLCVVRSRVKYAVPGSPNELH
ncbi:hypothetical protein PINS_up015734 [Pythium insidiosum]|nr:hypothetical protein PINS_up004469 [Pythium insidiosum]GLE06487.1 hypothetical protein PINS_up015734 [Pythium insidiosum]